MTAPAGIPEAPIAAPVITSPDIKADSVYAIDDTIAAESARAIAQTLAEMAPAGETPVPVAEAPKVEAPAAREDGATWNQSAGRWQLPSGAFAEGTAPEAPAAVASPDAPAKEPDPVALPEGLVAVKKVEGRELATKFRVLDHEGELEVPDMQIEFTANGKLRTEPLDKIVRMAEWGVYNLEREQQTTTKLAEAEQVLQQNVNLVRVVQQMQAERELLLSDDAAFLRARAEHEVKNSPEARLQAAEQRATQVEQQTEFQQAVNLGQQFLSTELQPAVNTIVTGCPTLTEEEIGAKLLLVSDRFRVNTQFGSIIPPAAYQAVRQAILTELVPWAQQVHDDRQSGQAHAAKAKQAADAAEAARKETAKREENARIEAQRTKTLIGRAATPGARSAPTSATPGREQPKPKANPSVEEAEADAVRDAIAATIGG